MKVKRLLVLPALLILLTLSCASPGDRLKKDNPTRYNSIVGNWYILSNDKPCEIIHTVSFNEDGTITDLSNFFGSNTRWSERIHGNYPENNSFTIYNPDVAKEYIYTDGSGGYITGGLEIMYNTKAVRNSLDKSNPYSAYMPLVNVMTWGSLNAYDDYFKSNVFVYVRDLDTLNILKEKMAKDKIDKEGNYKTFISKLDKNFNKGKFGGGYQDYKWGTKESEIIALLGEPQSKPNIDDVNLTALNYSFDDKNILFTFYEEALFEIVVTLDGDGESIFKNLKDKYGKPKITTSYDTKYIGAWKTSITYQDYIWSDSYTNIRVRYAKTSTICENCNNQYSYTPKLEETWVAGVVFQSNVISNYIKKLSDDKENNEKIKNEQQLKDNL